MRCRKRFNFLAILLLSGLQLAHAQPISDLPKILPAYSEKFESENSYSFCIENVFEDSLGRLWLPTCGLIKTKSNIFLFQFDGYEYHIIENGLSSLKNAKHVHFFDMNKKGELLGYGVFEGKQKLFKYNTFNFQFAFLNLENKNFTYDNILSTKKQENDNLEILFEAGHQFHFCKYSEDSIHLESGFSIDTSQLNPVSTISREQHIKYTHVFHGNDEIVLHINTEQYIFWNKNTNKIQLQSIDSFIKRHNPPYSSARNLWQNNHLIKQNDKNYLIANLPKKTLLTFEDDEMEFRLDTRFPKSRINFFCEDEVGNIIYVFNSIQKSTYAVLEDNNGKLYDYSALLPKGTEIIEIKGKDFKKQATICTSNGLVISKVTQSESIKNYWPNVPIRQIKLFKDEQLFVKSPKKPWQILDLKTDEFTPLSKLNLCNAENVKQNQVFTDNSDNIWLVSRNNFLKYNSILDTCEFFQLPFERLVSFSFFNNNRISLLSDKCLFIFDFEKNAALPVLKRGSKEQLCLSEGVEQIFNDKGKHAWYLTPHNLYKIDPEKREAERIDLNNNIDADRFSSFLIDENNRKWIGTFNKGLYIFDPTSQHVKHIDKKKGLPNNTVAGILQDEDGIVWVATFNGIALLSPEGEILGYVFENDGLTHNENNRFTALKTPDGKLVFGTIRGLNIVDPKSMKETIFSKKKAKIYLTELNYFDQQTASDTTQNINLQNLKTLTLPATQKYVNLSFALSSYVAPEKNQFAYMLEGIDKNWTPINNQHNLNLNNLPSGKYRLLVKGKDANGIWSANQIIIPIHAKEFFYNQYWFYLLCAFPFALFAFLWIQRLMSEKKRMAIEIQKATEIIQKDKALIEQQAEQLLEIDKAKSRFFTNISHEFRTPLTIISGMIDQIKTKPELWLEKGSKMIKENTQNLLNLVNQILDLRKLESQKLELNLVQGDIVQYLRYIISSFQPFAKSNGLQLHFLAAQPSIQMDYDSDKMLRIVSNLLSNALKYTSKGGHVYFHIDKKEINNAEFLQIRVQDTGKGIPEDQIHNIFDRFYQLDESIAATGQSTGIGLALVKELVRLMNGSIKVESELEKGTTFEIQLPITTNSPVINVQTELPDYIAQVESSSQEVFTQGREPTENPILLIVEDNADVVQFLIACLEDHYHLLIARNGQEGIDKAIEQVPDLIVSDVMMPKKDGFELCKTLKTDERTSHIPIILLTAKADFESKIEGLTKGADAYLAKPFEQKELLVRLKKLLELRQKLQQKYQSPEFIDTPSGHEDAFIQKVQKAVLDNLDDEDFDIVRLCRELAMSRSQIHRKLKALTDKSTSIFIRSIRLQKGRELLQTTDLSISEIAYQVGFRHPNHFSNFYSDVFGESPSETRKQL